MCKPNFNNVKMIVALQRVFILCFINSARKCLCKVGMNNIHIAYFLQHQLERRNIFSCIILSKFVFTSWYSILINFLPCYFILASSASIFLLSS